MVTFFQYKVVCCRKVPREMYELSVNSGKKQYVLSKRGLNVQREQFVTQTYPLITCKSSVVGNYGPCCRTLNVLLDTFHVYHQLRMTWPYNPKLKCTDNSFCSVIKDIVKLFKTNCKNACTQHWVSMTFN